MGPREYRTPTRRSARRPRATSSQSELNNPAIEPVAKKYAELRYRLMPYTYTLAREARDTGLPLMRAMWLHYPDDERARGLGTQYLWGRDLLVAPVFTKGATPRRVSARGRWYDWWTNGRTAGRPDRHAQGRPRTMPIYVRAGAIIPVRSGPAVHGQQVDEPTTLRIYRGADGDFTLYEDDGISQDYLRGKGTWTRIRGTTARSGSPSSRRRRGRDERRDPAGLPHPPHAGKRYEGRQLRRQARAGEFLAGHGRGVSLSTARRSPRVILRFGRSDLELCRDRAHAMDFYLKSVGGTSTEELLLASSVFGDVDVA